MSYASLLTHPLRIVTPAITGDAEDADDLDEYGQPTAAAPTVRRVQGLVQPKSTRELAAASQAGVATSAWTIFLPNIAVSESAYITDDPPAGRRFDITGVRPHAYGSAPHIEVDANLVGSTEGPTVEGS